MARRWALWIYVGYRCYYSHISSYLYLLASSLSVVILFKSMRMWKMVRVGNRLRPTPTRQVIIWMSKLARKSSDKYLPDMHPPSFLWPWDNNAMSTQEELQFMLPQFPYTITPRDLLDYRYTCTP
jgi:hypothetical protein